MKVGVIGCGGMGTTHYISLKALSEQEWMSRLWRWQTAEKEFLDKVGTNIFARVRKYQLGMGSD